MEKPEQAERGGRRAFLVRLGTGAGAVALAAQAGAALRSLAPDVSYDAPLMRKLGLPESFADGVTFLPDQRLFVIRDGPRLRALSAACTHLGCTVRSEAPERATAAQRFVCPCHGSRYDAEGRNVSGPAPEPLAAYRLLLAPDDGQIVADLSARVPRDVRLVLP